VDANICVRGLLFMTPFFVCGAVFIARTRDINGRFGVLSDELHLAS